MKLKEILVEEIYKRDKNRDRAGCEFLIQDIIPQIRKEVTELVKKSHGWFDFIKNLDKFCEEEKK